MKIESVKPFFIDGIKYSYSVEGLLFADSFAAAKKGYLALQSLPDELALLLKMGAKEKGLLLLFDSNREVMRGVAGEWVFATGHLPKQNPDLRQFLRNGAIKISGRQGNKIYDGAMMKITTAHPSQHEILSLLSHEGGHHFWFEINYKLASKHGYVVELSKLNPAELADPFFFRRLQNNSTTLTRSQLSVYFNELKFYLSANGLSSVMQIPLQGSYLAPNDAYLLFKRPLLEFLGGLEGSMTRCLNVKNYSLDRNLLYSVEQRLYSGKGNPISILVEGLHRRHPQIAYKELRRAVNVAATNFRRELGALFCQSSATYLGSTKQLLPETTKLFDLIKTSNTAKGSALARNAIDGAPRNSLTYSVFDSKNLEYIVDDYAMKFGKKLPWYRSVRYAAILRGLGALAIPSVGAFDFYQRVQQQNKVHPGTLGFANNVAAVTEMAIDWTMFGSIASRVGFVPMIPVIGLCILADATQNADPVQFRDNRDLFFASMVDTVDSPQALMAVMNAFDKGEEWTRKFNENTVIATKQGLLPFRYLNEFGRGVVDYLRDPLPFVTERRLFAEGFSNGLQRRWFPQEALNANNWLREAWENIHNSQSIDPCVFSDVPYEQLAANANALQQTSGPRVINANDFGPLDTSDPEVREMLRTNHVVNIFPQTGLNISDTGEINYGVSLPNQNVDVNVHISDEVLKNMAGGIEDWLNRTTRGEYFIFEAFVDGNKYEYEFKFTGLKSTSGYVVAKNISTDEESGRFHFELPNFYFSNEKLFKDDKNAKILQDVSSQALTEIMMFNHKRNSEFVTKNLQEFRSAIKKGDYDKAENLAEILDDKKFDEYCLDKDTGKRIPYKSIVLFHRLDKDFCEAVKDNDVDKMQRLAEKLEATPFETGTIYSDIAKFFDLHNQFIEAEKNYDYTKMAQLAKQLDNKDLIAAQKCISKDKPINFHGRAHQVKAREYSAYVGPMLRILQRLVGDNAYVQKVIGWAMQTHRCSPTLIPSLGEIVWQYLQKGNKSLVGRADILCSLLDDLASYNFLSGKDKLASGLNLIELASSHPMLSLIKMRRQLFDATGVSKLRLQWSMRRIAADIIIGVVGQQMFPVFRDSANLPEQLKFIIPLTLVRFVPTFLALYYTQRWGLLAVEAIDFALSLTSPRTVQKDNVASNQLVHLRRDNYQLQQFTHIIHHNYGDPILTLNERMLMIQFYLWGIDIAVQRNDMTTVLASIPAFVEQNIVVLTANRIPAHICTDLLIMRFNALITLGGFAKAKKLLMQVNESLNYLPEFYKIKLASVYFQLATMFSDLIEKDIFTAFYQRCRLHRYEAYYETIEYYGFTGVLNYLLSLPLNTAVGIVTTALKYFLPSCRLEITQQNQQKIQLNDITWQPTDKKVNYVAKTEYFILRNVFKKRVRLPKHRQALTHNLPEPANSLFARLVSTINADLNNLLVSSDLATGIACYMMALDVKNDEVLFNRYLGRANQYGYTPDIEADLMLMLEGDSNVSVYKSVLTLFNFNSRQKIQYLSLLLFNRAELFFSGQYSAIELRRKLCAFARQAMCEDYNTTAELNRKLACLPAKNFPYDEVKKYLAQGASPDIVTEYHCYYKGFSEALPQTFLLFDAAIKNRADIIALLADYGVDPGLVNHYRMNALECYFDNPYVKSDEHVIAELLAIGIDPDITLANTFSVLPSHNFGGRINNMIGITFFGSLNLLVSKTPVSRVLRDRDQYAGWTAREIAKHKGISFGHRPRLVKEAILKGDTAEAIRLFDLESYLSAQEFKNKTPLMYVTELMRENIDFGGAWWCQIAQYLLNKPEHVHATNHNGETALMHAVRHWSENLAWLLSLGLSQIINYRDNTGRTALMIAVELNNLDAVRTLLHYGADPNIMMKYDPSTYVIGTGYVQDDISPLMLSVIKHFVEITRLLLSNYKLEVNQKAKSGKTAFWYVLENDTFGFFSGYRTEERELLTARGAVKGDVLLSKEIPHRTIDRPYRP